VKANINRSHHAERDTKLAVKRAPRYLPSNHRTGKAMITERVRMGRHAHVNLFRLMGPPEA